MGSAPGASGVGVGPGVASTASGGCAQHGGYPLTLPLPLRAASGAQHGGYPLPLPLPLRAASGAEHGGVQAALRLRRGASGAHSSQQAAAARAAPRRRQGYQKAAARPQGAALPRPQLIRRAQPGAGVRARVSSGGHVLEVSAHDVDDVEGGEAAGQVVQRHVEVELQLLLLRRVQHDARLLLDAKVRLRHTRTQAPAEAPAGCISGERGPTPGGGSGSPEPRPASANTRRAGRAMQVLLPTSTGAEKFEMKR